MGVTRCQGGIPTIKVTPKAHSEGLQITDASLGLTRKAWKKVTRRQGRNTNNESDTKSSEAKAYKQSVGTV